MEKTKQKGVGRFTEEEVQIIKNTFKGNERLLKLIRKIFLPEITPELLENVGIGQVIDIYGSISPDRNPDDVVTDVKARNLLLAHLNTQLIGLQGMAEAIEETAEELIARMEKNSTK